VASATRSPFDSYLYLKTKFKSAAFPQIGVGLKESNSEMQDTYTQNKFLNEKFDYSFTGLIEGAGTIRVPNTKQTDLVKIN
jgi:hypothetical protein